MRKQAVFFVNLWPEPRSSAAGLRTQEVADFLIRLDYEVIGVAPGPASVHSESWQARGVRTLSCDPNQSSIEEVLKGFTPQVVVYDRFFVEELYGWRSRELWPEALQVIDTSDMHCIRRARQRAHTLGQSWQQMQEPDESLYEDDLLRELAALHRADVSLVVSAFEVEWLQKRGFERERILLLPFSARKEAVTKKMSQRSGYCFLGNYFHAPNLDAVRWLESELWPALRKEIPNAELFLYGAYPPPSISHYKGKNGIFCRGAVDDHRAAIEQHEVMLVPLRFGAGIKGKVLEAWATGTPVIGTPVSYEGLCENAPGSFLTPDEFVQQVMRMQDPHQWTAAAEFGKARLEPRFAPEHLFQVFREYLQKALVNIPQYRSSLTGRLLRHHSAQSSKYMSRWIEEKNKNLASR